MRAGVRCERGFLPLEQLHEISPEVGGARARHDFGAISHVSMEDVGGDLVRLRPFDGPEDRIVVSKSKNSRRLNNAHSPVGNTAPRFAAMTRLSNFGANVNA